MDRIILHIDMDAFFAAVEQRDHPQYRGMPVVVGADPKGGKGRGVVATCSYEARKFGIHSAMPISQAYQRCPFAVYLPGRMKRYQEISHQLMEILGHYSALIEQISIDEAFVDLTGCTRLLGQPPKIAMDMKDRIRRELQLTASIGIAPSKFVAKIASDLQKPDGLVIVHKDEVESFLRKLPISKMWGVGKKTEPLLIQMGIRTIGDLAACSRETILKKFGKSGYSMWQLARGQDDREVIPHVVSKSVSQETTFDEDTDDMDQIHHTLFYLCTELSRIIRNDRIKGKTITLKIRLSDFSTFTRSQSSCEFIDSSKDIYQVIEQLFGKFNIGEYKVRLLGVAISNLNVRGGEQMSLLENVDTEKKKADRVMDLVQEKFGIDAIKKASLMSERSYRLTEQKPKQKKT